MRFLLVGLLVLASCGGSLPTLPPPPPAPQPSPSPEPTPFPRLSFPLRTNGTRFVDAAGRPADLYGAVVCCGDPGLNGWPHISNSALNELADNGVNFTHIRLGPFSKDFPEGPQFSPSPSMWANVEWVAARTHELGIVLEVDVFDAWVLERGHNYSLFDWTCQITRNYPTREQFQWVDEVASYTAKYPNVIYQISNESFDCGALYVWELALAGRLRERAPGHLIGTNSQSAHIEPRVDYVSYHRPLFSPVSGKPTSINEYDQALWYDTADEWIADHEKARAGGVYLHAWRGGWDDNEWRKALSHYKGRR